MEVKINAFGARMTEGFPHRFENSFFHLATERLRQETGHDIVSSVSILGGMAAPQVLKQISLQCLLDKPDIVVLQFGLNDLMVPRRKNRLHQGPASAAHPAARPASRLHQLGWRVRGYIGDQLHLKPGLQPESYFEDMARLIRAVIAHGAIPVVLSPFVYGVAGADRLALECSASLGNQVAKIPTARYVGVYAALDRFPRHEMLLCDGTLLTIPGHVVAAERLHAALGDALRARAREATVAGV